MAQHGMLNSRMKDIFDVQALAERVEFDGPRLCEAIRATFERRGLPIGADLPAALTPAFAGDEVMRGRWDAFLSRNRLDGADLGTAIGAARRLLGEPWAALAHGKPFTRRWPAGGPWRDGSGPGGQAESSHHSW
jgi:hypothetical protein